MTDPTPLSPVAQAVWNAFRQFDEAGMHVDYSVKLAAALRAAADAYREENNGEGMPSFVEAIAAELEGAQ